MVYDVFALCVGYMMAAGAIAEVARLINEGWQWQEKKSWRWSYILIGIAWPITLPFYLGASVARIITEVICFIGAVGIIIASNIMNSVRERRLIWNWGL